jgi:hypothetical protein
LTELETMLCSLTYGNMMKFAEGIMRQATEKPTDSLFTESTQASGVDTPGGRRAYGPASTLGTLLTSSKPTNLIEHIAVGCVALVGPTASPRGV